MHHRPRKRFGQNFLQSEGIIDAIIRAIHLHSDDNALEIGPGLGALTGPLLHKLNRVTAIEIDRDLHAHLKALPLAAERLNLISGDALSFNYNQFGKHLRLIGNLPYNISTPLLIHLFHFLGSIQDMHFMLQKEVVNRLVASPGSKAFGRLSVMAQYHCEVDDLLDVPASAFYPPPKVESAIVRLIPYQNSPYPVVAWDDLERLVATAFAMRRKTLANNLKPILSAEQIQTVGIDPSLRPEQLTVMQYGLLTTLMSHQSNTGVC
ncbi:MAG: 16S rRNA (adenine(1518)-N(6)/adenine(1519)-N(6))-dimethyltransferase [Legionella sp.]|nr:MAG: 16S rRNA (adenine(1518)-N(6)/adenine(1519)-N(6))-dimethyltransferase [Legionella sp.]